jgi:protein phosphatase
MSRVTPTAPGSLITPLDPGTACRAGGAAAARAQQSVHTTAFSRIEAAVASSCGTQHAENEDAHSAVEGSGRLFVVADGVGGGAMAQLASQQLVSQLHATLEAQRVDGERVRDAMLAADRAIARRIAQVTDAPGAATVALCAPLNAFASKWLIAWVGDCRVYRLAFGIDEGIELLTRDDTFRHLDERPPCGGSPDDPARMVGNGATLGASVAFHDLASGGLLALCSDGVHKYLDGDEWQRLLQAPVPLARRCERLIGAARANGSTDDATLLLLQRTGLAMRRPRWIAHLAGPVDSSGRPR